MYSIRRIIKLTRCLLRDLWGLVTLQRRGLDIFLMLLGGNVVLVRVLRRKLLLPARIALKMITR